MLKNVYIICLVLLIGIGNIFIIQEMSKENNIMPPNVLGVMDINKIVPKNNETQSANSNKNSSKTNLNMSQTQQLIDIIITLEGNGCSENKVPNTCKLISNQKPGVVLKNCDEKSWDQCSFYIYQIGKREEDSQYILQSYSENSDKLLDILEYNIKTNTLKQIKTVLYQDISDKNNDVIEANNDYMATIERYKK